MKFVKAAGLDILSSGVAHKCRVPYLNTFFEPDSQRND